MVRNLKFFFCPTAQLNTQTPSQTVRAKLWQCVSRGVSDRHSSRHTMTQLVLRQAFNWENFSLVKIMCCFSLLRLVEPALALRFPQSCCVFCSVNYILQYFFSSPSMFNWPPYQSLFMRYEIEKGLRASRTSLIVRFSWGTKLKRDWERSNLRAV